jgi:hypothetical protein
MNTPKEETKEWRKRELRRLEDGTYRDVPWAKEGWYLDSPFGGIHFGHTSVSNSELIAYTPDYNKGERDVRNSAKPRKYLTKHFQDVLGDSGVEKWAGEFARTNHPVTVKFARTRAEIRWVYENGQRGCNPPDDDGTGSCMTYEVKDYKSKPIHPVEAYAFDLGIAYTLYPPGHKWQGRVNSRCTVWVDKKQYCRIWGRFGNEDTLRINLESMGYEHKDHQGARLLKLFTSPDSGYQNAIIAPYLDCYSHVRVEDDCLVLDSSEATGIADSQGGLLRMTRMSNRVNEFTCSFCDEATSYDDDHVSTANDGTICWHCYENEYYTCDDCDDVHHSNDITSVNNGNSYVCEECCSASYFYCESCDITISTDECVGDLPHGGPPICSSCLDDDDEHQLLDCGMIGLVRVVTEEVTTATCDCCGVTELNREEV